MIYPKLQIMIDHLKQLKDKPQPEIGFDMSNDYQSRFNSENKESDCGSACCIGGHAIAMLIQQYMVDTLPSDINPYQIERFANMQIHEALSVLCELPKGDPHDYSYKDVAGSICWSRGSWEYKDITLEKAITVLEHCRDTGEVDWSMVTKVC